MTNRLLRAAFAFASLGMFAACQQELQHNLSEQDANDILVLLSENGIDANKLKEDTGNEPTFLVKVTKTDYHQSAKLLSQYSLPRPKTPGLEMFRLGKGMIPTQTEERAMLIEALGGEVSKALQKVDGVMEARTIVNMPEVNDLTQPDKKPLPTASVLLKFRPSAEGKPPLDDNQVRRFVASSLPDMRPENVAVIATEAKLPNADLNPESKMQDVLGFRMLAASASQFRVTVTFVGIAVLLMAVFSFWTFTRSGNNAPQGRPRPRPKTEA